MPALLLLVLSLLARPARAGRFDEARTALSIGDYADARALLSQVVGDVDATIEDVDLAHHWLGRIAFDEGEPKAALGHFERVSTTYVSYPRVLLEAALAAREANDLDRAFGIVRALEHPRFERFYLPELIPLNAALQIDVCREGDAEKTIARFRPIEASAAPADPMRKIAWSAAQSLAEDVRHDLLVLRREAVVAQLEGYQPPIVSYGPEATPPADLDVDFHPRGVPLADAIRARQPVAACRRGKGPPLGKRPSEAREQQLKRDLRALDRRIVAHVERRMRRDLTVGERVESMMESAEVRIQEHRFFPELMERKSTRPLMERLFRPPSLLDPDQSDARFRLALFLAITSPEEAVRAVYQEIISAAPGSTAADRAWILLGNLTLASLYARPGEDADSGARRIEQVLKRAQGEYEHVRGGWAADRALSLIEFLRPDGDFGKAQRLMLAAIGGMRMQDGVSEGQRNSLLREFREDIVKGLLLRRDVPPPGLEDAKLYFEEALEPSRLGETTDMAWLLDYYLELLTRYGIGDVPGTVPGSVEPSQPGIAQLAKHLIDGHPLDARRPSWVEAYLSTFEEFQLPELADAESLMAGIEEGSSWWTAPARTDAERHGADAVSARLRERATRQRYFDVHPQADPDVRDEELKSRMSKVDPGARRAAALALAPELERFISAHPTHDLAPTVGKRLCNLFVIVEDPKRVYDSCSKALQIQAFVSSLRPPEPGQDPPEGWLDEEDEKQVEQNVVWATNAEVSGIESWPDTAQRLSVEDNFMLAAAGAADTPLPPAEPGKTDPREARLAAARILAKRGEFDRSILYARDVHRSGKTGLAVQATLLWSAIDIKRKRFKDAIARLAQRHAELVQTNAPASDVASIASQLLGAILRAPVDHGQVGACGVEGLMDPGDPKLLDRLCVERARHLFDLGEARRADAIVVRFIEDGGRAVSDALRQMVELGVRIDLVLERPRCSRVPAALRRDAAIAHACRTPALRRKPFVTPDTEALDRLVGAVEEMASRGRVREAEQLLGPWIDRLDGARDQNVRPYLAAAWLALARHWKVGLAAATPPEPLEPGALATWIRSSSQAMEEAGRLYLAAIESARGGGAECQDIAIEAAIDLATTLRIHRDHAQAVLTAFDRKVASGFTPENQGLVEERFNRRVGDTDEQLQRALDAAEVALGNVVKTTPFTARLAELIREMPGTRRLPPGLVPPLPGEASSDREADLEALFRLARSTPPADAVKVASLALSLGRVEDAWEALAPAVESSPAEGGARPKPTDDAVRLLALMRLHHHQLQRAAELFGSVLARHPGDCDALRGQAAISIYRGDRREADHWLQSALRLKCIPRDLFDAASTDQKGGD